MLSQNSLKKLFLVALIITSELGTVMENVRVPYFVRKTDSAPFRIVLLSNTLRIY